MQRLIFTGRRPVLWRSIFAFMAGVVFASLILGATKASAAELRVEYTSFRGIASVRTGILESWNACVKGAYQIRAQVSTARRLAIFCNGRRI